MNKIKIKEEIEFVELESLKDGRIFEYNTNYYMKMKSLGDDFVRDVGNRMWCCELGNGYMCVMTGEIKVKPIYGTIEITV